MTAYKDLKTQKHPTDRVINQIQDNIDAAISPILKNVTSKNKILENITLEVGTVNYISHTLGVELTGWHIIRQRAGAVIWDDQDNCLIKNKFLQLKCSAPCVVDILVF